MSDQPLRPPTVRDIAAAIGVHQSTVSRALHGDLRIRREVREKVVRCAEELGYRPNPYVSAFTAQVRSYRRIRESAILALLDCNLEAWPHGSSYRVGAEKRARERGFSTELFRMRDLDHSFERLNRLLWTRSIFQLLVLPVPLDFDLSPLRLERMACATVDTSVHTLPIHRSAPDYFNHMKLALDVLASRGYRRITFCTNRLEIGLLGEEWLGAFLGWQMSRPKDERISPYISDNWQPGSFEKWFLENRPDAVIANSHPYFHICEEMGFKSPEVAKVALNAGVDYPGLAGVSQNHEEVGSAAVDIVLDQIHRNEYGLPKMAKKLLIPGRWIEGNTVRAATEDSFGVTHTLKKGSKGSYRARKTSKKNSL